MLLIFEGGIESLGPPSYRLLENKLTHNGDATWISRLQLLAAYKYVSCSEEN